MKRALLLLILALGSIAVPRAAEAEQVAKNDSGTPSVEFATGTSGNLTTFTVSAGSNLGLIVIVQHRFASVFVTNVTAVWDSAGSAQAMTSCGVIDGAGATSRLEIFKLANPAVGNKNLLVSWTGASDGVIGAIAFSGVDQANVVEAGDTVTATATSASPSRAVTSTTNGATVAATNNNGQTITSTDTQTQIYRVTGTNVLAAASYGLGGTSNTHSWTMGGSAEWIAMGVHVLAAASAAPCNLLLLGAGRCGEDAKNVSAAGLIVSRPALWRYRRMLEKAK